EDHGNANLKDVPENFSKRCPHLKELLAIVNCLYELYVRSNYWQVQRQNTRKLLSRQLSGVSEVLANIAKEVSDFGSERELLEREFAHAIAKRGFAVENAGITSFGTKYMDVWAEFSQCPGEIRCRQLVEEEISHILNKDYLVHDLCCDGGVCSERCRYRLLAKGARHISFGKAQLAKDDGICGDCGATLLLEDGRQLLMVSDGMGVGRKASIESGTALSLVSRLLEAGFCKETTIDTVNATLALRAKQESFVTLDLCLVDLYSGEIEFVKTGGAPSFLKRGSQVKVIKGSSLPVGMLTNVESEKISERAVNGDLIILTSDGVLEGDVVKDTQWLVRILEQAPESTAQGLSEYLLEKVIALNGGRLKDDITIMVAKIDAA
ncbi:MAG: SpoIIE family protein phosphatase, partial [Clostridiales bacterium]